MSLQNSIGSDIIMQLDDVIQTTSPDHDRMKEAMERSVRWLDRCIAAHKYPETQNLFCIIQGGLDLEMRKQCCEAMILRDTPGVAIGGLSGGEAKDEFCKVYVYPILADATGIDFRKCACLYRYASGNQAKICNGHCKCSSLS